MTRSTSGAVAFDSSRGLQPGQAPTMNKGVEEQLLPQNSAIASGVASQLHAIGGALHSELPSPRRAAQFAAGLGGPTFALWLAGGAAAGGFGLLALVAGVTAFKPPYLLGPFFALLLPVVDR